MVGLAVLAACGAPAPGRVPPVGSGTTSTAPTTTTTAPSSFPVGRAATSVTTTVAGTTVTYPVSLYYPALAAGTGAAPARQYGPFPLVLFSQGFDEDPSGYDLLLGQWAAAGFVVAAPTYPHTDPGPGLDRSDIVHHPAELSAAISEVLAESAQPGTVLTGLVSSTAIAAAGQSDGGDVTLAAAANTCCRDARLKAALVLSGAEYGVFGGSYYAAGSPPLLVTQGSADSAAQGNAPICSVQLYNAAPAPKYYLDLLGAGHLPPYTQPDAWEPVVRAVTVDFLDAYLKGEAGAVAALAADGTSAGVATITTAPSLPVPGGVCTG